jgi:hypothetical protein
MTRRAPSPGPSSRASLEVRRALLDVLSVPAGQAVVERQRSLGATDQLNVRLAPSARPAARPTHFQGFPVSYSRLEPARSGG